MKYKRDVYHTLALITQLGLSMLAPIFLCTFAGMWLEKRIDFPFTVILVILGILAGCRNTYILAKSAIRDSKDEEDE